MANDDKEVATMSKCQKMLSELEPEERHRVLNWLTDKFGIRTVLASAESVEVECAEVRRS